MNNISKQSGYSLIELIVVISIMVLLVGVGSSIYSRTKYINEVNNSTNDIQGLLFEARSQAESDPNSNTLGYRLNFDQENRSITLNRMEYLVGDINQLEKGSVEEGDYRLEEKEEIKLNDNIVFSDLSIYTISGNRLSEIKSLAFLNKGSKLVFNGGIEPDLGQNDNLYSPFNLEPSSSGADIAQISLKCKDQEKNFSKSVKIYLKTGQVEIY